MSWRSVVDCVGDGRAGLLVEAGDPQVADLLERPRAHRLDRDVLALQGDLERLLAVAAQGDRDLAARLAAHHLDRLAQVELPGRCAGDADDQVARLDVAGRGRRALDRGDHLDEAVLLLGHPQAEAAVFALSVHLHRLELLRREVAGVRVQVGHHAVDRGPDQLLAGHVFDVGALNLLHHGLQVLQAHAVAVVLAERGAGHRQVGDGRADQEGGRQGEDRAHRGSPTKIVIGASRPAGRGRCARAARRRPRNAGPAHG
ncbi:MAG: hypothetical protein U5L06_10000 [Rhodovibrio sp.]|nr:hypothetical protein [Rhodovibrio sp.]